MCEKTLSYKRIFTIPADLELPVYLSLHFRFSETSRLNGSGILAIRLYCKASATSTTAKLICFRPRLSSAALFRMTGFHRWDSETIVDTLQM